MSFDAFCILYWRHSTSPGPATHRALVGLAERGGCAARFADSVEAAARRVAGARTHVVGAGGGTGITRARRATACQGVPACCIIARGRVGL
jgi:hypothetical protein